jgi:hypothetical protein
MTAECQTARAKGRTRFERFTGPHMHMRLFLIFLLRFGRFLNFTTTVVNSESLPPASPNAVSAE